MELKKKIKNFFTLTRKANGGFTLVELIVVIAILAILASVGSAGYAGYIKAANMEKDRTLVGNVMRALETSAYSYVSDFNVEGQYSTGLQKPVGFVILSDETITTRNGKSGTVVAISNDEETDPIGKALADALGNDYATQYKLNYPDWKVGAIGGNLHNATSGMIGSVEDAADIMIILDSVGDTFGIDFGMTSGDYDSTDDMIVDVATNISNQDKEAFIQSWLDASNQKYDQVGFGLSGRENYSTVRMAYNNSFAEYVRANYEGDATVANAIANEIANYGQSAGDLAYDKAYEKAYNKALFGKDAAGKLAGIAAREGVEAAAPNATFPYTANADAIANDSNFLKNYDTTVKQDISELYQDWLATSAAADAATFYDTMVTAANDGAAYKEANPDADFIEWIKDEAEAYSANLSAVQTLVNGKCAIVVVAYYKNGLIEMDVYSTEANPRN